MSHLLEVDHLSVSYSTYAGCVQSVRDISFSIENNRATAIVGESGCGKSVTAKSLLGLIEEPGKIDKNSVIRFQGKNLIEQTEKEWRNYRGNQAAMIFQDALAALNPTMKVGKQIAESLLNHTKMSVQEREKAAEEMLTAVGIADAKRCLNMYPHELSGGMRQRVMIASAFITKPKLLVADEPTTALDVTIQAQILKLMKTLQRQYEMSVLLITHDLGVVADFADDIIVMYAGKIVERGTSDDIFYHPQHPYTWALIHAVPRLSLNKNEILPTIQGMVPDMINPPSGCSFCDRCPYCMAICQEHSPEETSINDYHKVSCWLQLDEVEKSNIRFLTGGKSE
jgi:oligopeptide transport system ATP-binding protein